MRWIDNLVQAAQHLVYDHHHHEQQIDSKRPHHELLRPFQATPGNQVLFQPGELFRFERIQNQLLIGGGNRIVSFVLWGSCFGPPTSRQETRRDLAQLH